MSEALICFQICNFSITKNCTELDKCYLSTRRVFAKNFTDLQVDLINGGVFERPSLFYCGGPRECEYIPIYFKNIDKLEFEECFAKVFGLPILSK